MTYASKRRKQGPRQVPTPPPMRVPQLPQEPSAALTARMGLLAGLAVFLFVGGLGLYLSLPRTPAPKNEPSWVRQHRGVVSAFIGLPRPTRPAEVPAQWVGLTLGMARSQLAVDRLSELPARDIWADVTYRPDLARPDVVLGLSFHKDRLCKVVLNLGEDSMERADSLVTQAHSAYGQPRSYEYLTGTGTHVVAVFQSQERMLKLDGLKTPTGVRLTQVILMDATATTARELVRRPTRH